MTEPADSKLTPDPTVADFAAAQLALLLEDQRRRWLEGERVLAETYLEQHPDLRGDEDAVVDLLYHEILLRREAGEQPELHEYEERFPDLAGLLRLQLEVDRALSAGSLPDPAQQPTLSISATERPTAAELPVITGYTVLSILGRGGMGIVYKAWHLGLKRLVTIKMLREGIPDAEERARFRTEAEAVARLRHPHIVHIYEIGELAGRQFCVFEFVEGMSLAEKLQGVPQPTRDTALLVEILARTVHYAHQQGIVHRDLKPANILLGAKQQAAEYTPSAKPQAFEHTPKITDFGLAKRLDDDTGQTRSGAILGTPNYMAPEQAGGQSKAIGPTADVYALGAILYEMLTGRPPFQGATVLDTLEQVRSVEPVPPSRLQPKLSVDLETITLKCLEKDPARRYPTALELAEELRLYQNDQPIRARPIGKLVRAWRWCRRNPAWTTVVAAAVLFVTTIALLSSVAAYRFSQVASQAQQAEREARERLFQSKYVEGQAVRRSGRMGQRMQSLQALREAAQLARELDLDPQRLVELRNEAIAALALPDMRVDREWEGFPPGSTGLRFDSRYERYARADGRGNIQLHRVVDDAELFSLRYPLTPERGPRVRVRFSPGDRYLTAWVVYPSGDRPFYLWDLADPKRKAGWSLPHVTSPCALAAGDDRMAVTLPDGFIHLYELGSGKEIRRLARGIPGGVLAFSPDGTTLASSGAKPLDVRLLDASTGAVVGTLHHPGEVENVAWDPDGTTLAVGCADHRIYLWEARTGRRLADLQGHQWEVPQVEYSHGGDLLLSAGWDNTIRLWEPRLEKQLLNQPSWGLIGFSADDQVAGARVYGSTVGLYRVVRSAEYRTFRNRAELCTKFDFTRDGRLLFVGGSTNEPVRIWDLATGKELGHFDESSFLFDPATNSFLTHSKGLLRRWPIRAESAGAGLQLSLGPPKKLMGLGQASGALRWCGEPGKALVVSEAPEGVSLVALQAPVRRVQHWRPKPAPYWWVAASPDGQWIAASSGEGGTGTSVWNATSGGLVKTWDFGETRVAFSPDGKWLVTTTGSIDSGGAACSFWRVGSWELDRRLPLDRTTACASAVFSHDGKLLALAHTVTEVVLLDPATGKEVARLEGPEPQVIHQIAFSPDDSGLVVGCGMNLFEVWDLGRIRRQLRDLGLDWDPSSVPGAQTEEKPPPPLRFEVLPQ
jgi:serine/threonine protein kinase/WD40 repeat protein